MQRKTVQTAVFALMFPMMAFLLRQKNIPWNSAMK